jgi:hypothetical protein
MPKELGKHFNEFGVTRIQWKSQFSMTKFGWTKLPQPPYSPDLTPSDFHLFGALKDAVHSTKFETDGMIHAVRTWLLEQDRHGTDKAYTHLFLTGARPYKWTETLWKNRVWSQIITVPNVLFS